MATATQEQGHRFAISSVVPLLGWIRTYDTKTLLRPDVLAGLTVAAFSIPESMAYAGLAGLSPENGLYASMLALLVYAFFGSSRHMSVGVTSALAIMVAGTLGTLALDNPDDYLAAAQLVAIFAGVIALVAGILKLGFVVNFISESVLIGFSTGAALYIASSQLSKLFGIEGVQGNFFERVWNVIKNISDTNGWTLALGIASLVLLLVAEELFPKLPTSLFIVILAIGLMYISDLEDRGVAVAGNIPTGLPSPRIPTVDADLLPALIGLAFGCFLLSYVEGVSTARTLAARHKEKVNANQELYANGAINLASGLFRGFSVGGSMSRSAVNEEAGARTPLAGGFAAVLLAIVLLILTAPFEKLPETTLAAIVLVAVRGLLDIPGMQRLWKLSRLEFAAAALTMAGVLLIGMLEGILIGAGFSVLGLIWRISQPHTAVLGRIPGTNQFGDLTRHPENEQVPGVVIVRADNDIVYPNVEAVKDHLTQAVEVADPPTRLVVVDLTNTPLLDLAGIDMLDETSQELAERGASLKVAGTTGAVRDALRAAGLAERLGPMEAGDDVSQVVDMWQGTPEPAPKPSTEATTTT
jgi:high affinity sulfate transporter 1